MHFKFFNEIATTTYVNLSKSMSILRLLYAKHALHELNSCHVDKQVFPSYALFNYGIWVKWYFGHKVDFNLVLSFSWQYCHEVLIRFEYLSIKVLLVSSLPIKMADFKMQ